MNRQTFLLLVAGVLAGVGGTWLLMRPQGGAEPEKASGTLVSRVDREQPGKASGRKVATKGTRRPGVAVQELAVKREKPKFDIGEEEERRLTAEQHDLIEAIRNALRDDDYKLLMKLVRRMQASEEWPDGIPNAVKKAALEALGWYGSKCLPEIIGFLGDQDPSIVADAVSQWEDAIAECDSDRDISMQVKLASKVVSDPEAVESILVEIMGMRHSVGVDTLKAVLASGNGVAVEKVRSVIADFTDSTTITTVEELDAWLKDHPDEPGDEELYGGMTDDDDDAD